MGKIGNYYLELQEQANELGYETVEEAIADGCKVDISKQKLITPLEQKIDDEKTELEKAHEAWLEEKKALLEELENLHDYFVEEDDLHYSIVVAKAIEFIKKGEI